MPIFRTLPGACLALAILGAAAALAPPGQALAETAPPPPAAGPGQMPPPNPGLRARLDDGRVAFVAAALRLTPEQQPLWPPVAEALKQLDDAGQPAPPAEPPRQNAPRVDPAGRLDHMADDMTARAGALKRLAAVVRPLAATLSDEQKQAFDIALGPCGPGPRGPGVGGPGPDGPPPPPPGGPDAPAP